MKTTYYLIDLNKAEIEKPLQELTNSEWKQISESQNFVMTQEKFEIAFNKGLINTETDVLRIIKEQENE